MFSKYCSVNIEGPDYSNKVLSYNTYAYYFRSTAECVASARLR